MDTSAWADSIWREALRPDPSLLVSEWADQFRHLSQRASAEPGRWSTDRTPYLRAPMDDLSASSSVEVVVFMKGAQVGGTEAGNNWLGYVIDRAPGPSMLVLPTVEMAKRASRQRLDPMIEESPELSRRVRPARARDSGNTMLSKDFPGGVLMLTGANSAVGLRSMPVRYLFLDEVDGFPADADGEGDPVELAMRRTSTFARRKVLMVSTPTVEGSSRISTAYAETDQRRFFVPCPHCGGYQVLVWQRVTWTELDRDPADAAYVCEHCERPIENSQKPGMLARGEWRPTAEPKNPRARGYHISALYSPWYAWGEAARDFLAAGNNPSRLKVFTNTILGETWQDRGEAPDWLRLYERREAYRADCLPAGVVLITVGVDVQGNRVVWEVVGWGRGKESWSLDAGDMPGDTGNEASEAYAALDAILDRDYQTEDGRNLRVAMLAIDSGHQANTVYNWTRRHSKARVIAIKGRGSLQSIVGAPIKVDVTVRGKKLAGGQQYYPVGINIIKSELYGWLKRDKPDNDEEILPGYCHFPEYGQDFFKQLTAEHLVTRRNKKGYVVTEWEQIPGRENHYLDCRVYARAAASLYGLDRARESDWVRMGAVAVKRTAPPQAQHAPPEMQAPAASVARKSPESSNWLSTSRPVSSRRGGWFSRR